MTSATKIANTLKTEGKGTDQKTVDKYIRGLSDSLMLYEAQRYHLKGKMSSRPTANITRLMYT